MKQTQTTKGWGGYLPEIESPTFTDYYLTACAIIKNEAPYLKEWLEFHKLMGVEKFLLYDNGSTDQTRDVLLPYLKTGFVEVIPWENFLQGANHQHLAYAHACVHMAHKTEWLAFLDADEFLFSPQGSALSTILKELEEFPSIGVFLYCFGPSGHRAKPEGLVIENYTLRLPEDDWQNTQYKSIVRPHLIRSVISAQRFHHRLNNIPAYNEEGKPLLHSTHHMHTSKRLRINHYAAKSLKELEAKIQRPYFWDSEKIDKRRAEKMKQHTKLTEASVQDLTITRFAPELQKAMNRPPSSVLIATTYNTPSMEGSKPVEQEKIFL
ncbi:MAG: glycosyltransferase family 92 protein [Nitrospirota bacterium]|nr:glycosyltransferase family 92 protein [Nitrospirota bacterium]